MKGVGACNAKAACERRPVAWLASTETYKLGQLLGCCRCKPSEEGKPSEEAEKNKCL